MKKIKLTLLIAILIFANSLAFSQKPEKAQLPPKQKQFGIENRIPDLSNEQKEQIKNERTKFMSDVLPLKNTLKEKQAHLNTLQTAKDANIKAINNTIDEIGSIRTDIAKRKALFRQKIRTYLNDEQRIYFDTHFSKNKAKMRNKMHKKCNRI